jgi:hypothetical protein
MATKQESSNDDIVMKPSESYAVHQCSKSHKIYENYPPSAAETEAVYEVIY